MKPSIQNFISKKRIAVVGFSRNKNKFGTTAFSELQKRGFEVFAIHPNETEINGVECYPDLKSVSGKAEAVFISIPPKSVPPVLKEAADAGFKLVWLQQGAESEESTGYAKELGLELISGKCILMYAPPVTSFHKFHQVVCKWTGNF